MITRKEESKGLRLVLTLVFFLASLTPRLSFGESCATLPSVPGAEVRQCGHLQIIKLKGKPIERARAMGQLVREGKASLETLTYFTQSVSAAVKDMPFYIRVLAEPVLDFWSAARVKQTQGDLIEELQEFARTAGVDPNAVMRAAAVPDFAVFLTGLSTSGALSFAEGFGCTSAIKRFDDGSFVFGRNLDFAGTRVWDQHPMVVVHEPEAGSAELRHISISSAPLFFSSISGINEAGIALTLHQNFTRDVNGRGVPVFLIGEAVLRKARSIEDAAELLRTIRPGPMWTYVVGDLKTGRAFTAESSAHEFKVRWMKDNTLAQTNHLQNFDEKRRSEIETLPYGTGRNSRTRLRIANARLAEARSENAARDIAGILAYQADPNGELASHLDILKGDTIQSVIFEKSKDGNQSLSVAQDLAPTSGGTYIRIGLDSLWEGLPLDLISADEIRPWPVTESQRRNQLAIAEAYTAYKDQKDLRRVIEILSLQSSPAAALVRSLAYYKLAQWDSALAEIETSLSTGADARDQLTGQSLRILRILTVYARDPGDSRLRAWAEELLAMNPDLPDARSIAEKIASGKKLKKSDLKLTYDWFAGDLRWGLTL